MYEQFEHTADLGLRVRAANLNTVFAEAADCLFSVIVENPESIRAIDEQSLELAGEDREYLLFDWLRELLNRFETEHWLLAKSEVRVGPTGLSARLWGEPFDPARHRLAHEVKAITYHELSLKPTPDGWLAEVIIDI